MSGASQAMAERSLAAFPAPGTGGGAAGGESGEKRARDGAQHMARAATREELVAWQWQHSPADDIERLSQLLLRWSVDPVTAAIEGFRMVPQRYQAQALLDLFDAPREVYAFYDLDPTFPKNAVLLPSGHGLGKTRLEALAIWIHTLTRMFSKRLVTAPSADQLTGQLWGEIRKLYRKLKQHWPALAADWEILGSSITHRNPDYGDWTTVARTSRADNPEALQGGHALDADDEFGQLAELFQDEHASFPSGGILVIIEEASGVHDTIRETLEGSLSEEGAKLLCAGNPTRPDGWFAEDLDKTERYAVHPLDCRISNRAQTYTLPYRDFNGHVHHLAIRGFVDPKYWAEILKECDGDEDHDRFRVRVRGMKPRSAFEQCLKTHWVEAAQRRQPDPDSKKERAVIGLDFGLRADKHALAVRQGFNLLDGDEWLPRDTPAEITLQAAERAIEAQRLFDAGVIIGDSNGVGRGAMEYLHRYYAERPELGVVILFFNSGTGASDRKRYYRRRDEMWFKYGRQHIANPRCHLLELPGLLRQLTVPGFHEDATRRIRVESKEDIFKRTKEPSGNLADAYLQTLMTGIQTPQPPAPPKGNPHELPDVFKKHFDRLRREQQEPDLIR